VVCKWGLAGAAVAVVVSQYTASMILLRSLVANHILRLGDLRVLPGRGGLRVWGVWLRV